MLRALLVRKPTVAPHRLPRGLGVQQEGPRRAIVAYLINIFHRTGSNTCVTLRTGLGWSQ